MAKILMGLETEYAFTPSDHDDNPLERKRYADILVGLAHRRHAALQGCNPGDLYLANGSRLYVDAGLGLINLEYSTPECSSPEMLLAHIRAGDRIVAQLARDLEATCPEVKQAFISKTSFDYNGHTAGSHENYSHRCPQAVLGSQLLPHLVTRILFSGGGGFDDQSPGLRFMLSPRVAYLEEVISDGAQSNRGIFTTRMEPLSHSSYARLHLLCGEGLRFPTSEYLRFATTALLVCLADAGLAPARAIKINPLRAIEAVASDTHCRVAVGWIDGREASAIDIQRHYLEQVEAQLDQAFMPDWSPAACDRWRSVLDTLESQPLRLAGVLDWPTKLVLYRDFVEEHADETFQSANGESEGGQLREQLFECDIRFGDIAQDDLFHSADMIDAGLLDQALQRAPRDSRAGLRGDWIQRLNNRPGRKRCNWDGIADFAACRHLRFDDPFGSAPVKWLRGISRY